MSKYRKMTRARIEKNLDDLWKAGMDAGRLDDTQKRELDDMLAARRRKRDKAIADAWALKAVTR